MEFILDTVDLEEIKDGVDHMPIVGVTSNPSIVKKTSPEDFFGHMRKVREIIGKERSLHVQVISLDAETIVKEAHRILEEIDDQVYIKVPAGFSECCDCFLYHRYRQVSATLCGQASLLCPTMR